MSKQYIFNLTEDEKDIWMQAAAKRGISMEEYMNVAIAEALLNNQTDAWHMTSLEDMASELEVDLDQFDD